MKEKVYIKDFIILLLSHKKALFLIMLTCVLCMIQLSAVLPKTYKSFFELNIYSKYFKNALISEVIPGMNSIAEMTQTTDSMVKETLNDAFIDEIGNEFNIYAPDLSPYELAKAREQLRWRFEMFSTGGQSYRVGFTHGDPMITYEVTQKVMEAVRNTFINSRIETIENAKKTILEQLESLSVTKHITDDSISTNALASKNPDVLRSEIMKINSDLSALKLQFNVAHPQIVQLENRKATIENWLNELEIEGNSESRGLYTDAPLLMSGNKEISQHITGRLFAKFNDITVALDLEKKSLPSYIGVLVAPQLPTAPLFPKRRLFASLGFVLGVVFCFAYVFFKEVISFSTEEKAQNMAKNLQTRMLGTLPHIDEKSLMTNKAIGWDEIRLLEVPPVYYIAPSPSDNVNYPQIRH